MPVHRNPETALPVVGSVAVSTRHGYTEPIAPRIAVVTKSAGGTS